VVNPYSTAPFGVTAVTSWVKLMVSIAIPASWKSPQSAPHGSASGRATQPRRASRGSDSVREERSTLHRAHLLQPCSLPLWTALVELHRAVASYSPSHALHHHRWGRACDVVVAPVSPCDGRSG